MGFPSSSAGEDSACNAGNSGLIPESAWSPGEGIGYPFQYSWASLVAQLVKNLRAMWETWVLSLGWEDPLEEGRSPGEGNSYPLQYSDLENSLDCIVYGVTKSQKLLSHFHFLSIFFFLFTIIKNSFNNISLTKSNQIQADLVNGILRIIMRIVEKQK